MRRALLAAAAVAVVVLTAPAAQASFPGRNGLIVFVRYTGAKPGIYVVAANGKHLRRLVATVSKSFGAFNPVWSPGGSSIAYFDWEKKTDTPTIKEVGAGGGTPRVVVSGTGANTPGDPEWTADGLVSWQTSAQGGTCVQVAGETQPRFCSAKSLSNGRWSSDGGYAGVEAGYPKSTLVLVGSSGSVSPVTAIYGYQYDWSPDGHKFVFTTLHNGKPDLAAVKANGSGKRVLAVQGWQPAWSPDGTKIAFNDEKGLAIVAANGSHLVQLTHNPTDEAPDWQSR